MKRQSIEWCSSERLKKFNESGYVAIQVIETRKDYKTGFPFALEYLCLLEKEGKQ
jgi:hypothetical protein